MLRALIIDDEEASRERLRRLLSSHEIEIVGEAADGPQAIERIEGVRPDVVFLDIQMPGCSGLEVAASLSSPRPRVVFCTAYDHYAVDAFELNAVDYLLKPVSRARLAKAIERILDAGESPEDKLDQLHGIEGGFPTRFLGKRGSRFRVVPVGEVSHFLSVDGLTRLQTADDHYWMQPSLTDLEKRLDPAHFVRISRSAILHLDAVREVVPSGGSGEVRMADGTRLEVSRRRFKLLMERLNAG